MRTGDREAERRLLDQVRLAVDLEIPLIQLREKSLTALELSRLAEKIVEITQGTKTRLLINDRADIAAAVDADGVHLTSNSLPARVVRSSFPKLIIGVSTHDEIELTAAVESQADFAVFGPIYESPGKGAAKGVKELRRMCETFPNFPILGLGGISLDNIDEVIAAGATGVAAIRLFADHENLAAATRRSVNFRVFRG